MNKLYIQKNIFKSREDFGNRGSYYSVDEVLNRSLTITEVKEDIEVIKDDISSLQTSTTVTVMPIVITPSTVEIQSGDGFIFIVPDDLDGTDVVEIRFVTSSGGANTAGQYDIEVTNYTTADTIANITLPRNIGLTNGVATLTANTTLSAGDIIIFTVAAVPTGGVFGTNGLFASLVIE